MAGTMGVVTWLLSDDCMVVLTDGALVVVDRMSGELRFEM